ASFQCSCVRHATVCAGGITVPNCIDTLLQRCRTCKQLNAKNLVGEQDMRVLRRWILVETVRRAWIEMEEIAFVRGTLRKGTGVQIAFKRNGLNHVATQNRWNADVARHHMVNWHAAHSDNTSEFRVNNRPNWGWGRAKSNTGNWRRGDVDTGGRT